MRRILYLTGTRADFGLMEATLRAIHAHPALQLQLAVTGMHLSPQYGETVREIEATGLPIVARIRSDVDSRTPAGMARAIGDTVLGMTAAIEEARPDVLLLLGDRGEMLAGAIAALHLGVVIAHLHGGERSGTVDEPVRHAISKLAHWHFAATEESRRRLVRMGEAEQHVWVTGAPSLDGLLPLADQPRAAALGSLGLQPADRYILVLFHPVVQQESDAYAQTQALAQALRDEAQGRRIVWLAPNADAGSAAILQGRADAGQGDIVAITHLPRAQYVAALRHADLLAGNSSSGIIEAASFGTPVVNIGQRQNARERNANTRDCGTGRDEIGAAVRAALARGPYPPANVYGDGAAAGRIVRRLAEEPVTPALLHKVNQY